MRAPLLIALMLCAVPLRAGGGEALPRDREVRAVWLTTLLGLDWPASSLRGNVAAQQQALRDILDDMRKRHYNVVLFQVRSRGNAMYRSAIEPWASELTGELGRDPGWDPLDFAIREAHARGMELHAWFNVFRVWSAGMPPRSTPAHLAHAHPDWVKRHGDDLWLDPGIPEAREYTLRVMEDLVRRYDVDGIHFDYCRYPERDFADEETWKQHGTGARDDWRRGNVNALVRDAYQRLGMLRPGIIVGSAPIGIYTSLPGARGWEGRNAIFQDSRAWLAGGYHDYVTPQIYWGLPSRGSRIDFAALVRDWVRGASGRQVVAGVAAYKEDIQPWLHEHIDVLRNAGAHGVAFFRYAHVRGNDMNGRFASHRLPPPLPWKDNVAPNPPRAVRIVATEGLTRIGWDAPLPASDGEAVRFYAVYGRATEDQAPALLAVLPGDSTAATLNGVWRDVRVTALDRARNESEPAGEGVAALAEQREGMERDASPGPMQLPGMSEIIVLNDEVLLVAVHLPFTTHVRLRLFSEHGSECGVLLDEQRAAGVHVIGIERARMDVDADLCVFETDARRQIAVVPGRSGE